MGVPIDFDRQLGLDAVEVDAIRSDAVLAAKPVPAQLASTQARPQLGLGWGQLLAQTAPQACLGGSVEEFGHCGASRIRFGTLRRPSESCPRIHRAVYPPVRFPTSPLTKGETGGFPFARPPK